MKKDLQNFQWNNLICSITNVFVGAQQESNNFNSGASIMGGVAASFMLFYSILLNFCYKNGKNKIIKIRI